MSSSIFFAVVLTLGCLKQVSSEREHKVHNIVLYPEKHSWCQTTPIQQVVGSPGYESVTIANNVCVGACFSYSIPKTQPAEEGELIGPYCDSCKPSEIKCYHVNLHADNTNLEGPPTIQKRVQIIMNCSCQSCDAVRKEDCEITDQNTLELPNYLFTDQESKKTTAEDFPELFDAQNNTQHQSKNTENDINLKNKLKQWFEVHQNETEDNDIGHSLQRKHKEIMDLQNSLDNIEENNAKIEKDLEHLPKNFGLEGVPTHQKGSHIAAGIELNGDLPKKHPEHSQTNHHGHHGHHPHHNNHPNHHLGEEQEIGLSIAHLIRGPHGSMVLTPGEAKLHIDSDALKPNNEGVVIEYENHHKDPN